jgi:hypothetical protein
VYSIAAMAMIAGAMNLYLSVGLIEHLCCLPADVYAGALFVLSGMFIVAVVDPACLAAMFIPSIRTDSAASHPCAFLCDSQSELQIHFIRAICALNWCAGYGVLCAACRIAVEHTVPNYTAFIFPTQDLLHDLATGDIEINALLRTGAEKSWENKYGLVCAFYFYGVLSALVITRAIASRRFAILKIVFFVTGGLCMALFAQFFTKQNLPATAGMLFVDAMWIWHLVQNQMKALGEAKQTSESDSESKENSGQKMKMR